MEEEDCDVLTTFDESHPWEIVDAVNRILFDMDTGWQFIELYDDDVDSDTVQEYKLTKTDEPPVSLG